MFILFMIISVFAFMFYFIHSAAQIVVTMIIYFVEHKLNLIDSFIHLFLIGSASCLIIFLLYIVVSALFDFILTGINYYRKGDPS